MLSEIEASILVSMTTMIYEETCREFSINPVDARSLYIKGHPKSKKISQRYRDRVCELDSRFLELILLSHEQGLTTRAQETLNAISLELVERGLLGEGETKEIKPVDES